MPTPTQFEDDALASLQAVGARLPALPWFHLWDNSPFEDPAEVPPTPTWPAPWTAERSFPKIFTRNGGGEHRRSLHRAIAVRALATLGERTGRTVDVATLARSAWPRDERVLSMVRAAQIPTSTADYPTFDPATAFRSLAPSSAALACSRRGLLLDLTGVSTIRIPSVAGLPAQPIFVGEGLAAPVLQWSFVSTVVGPARKILMQAVVSDELDNATPETATAVIGRVLADVANRAIDTVAFSSAADSTKPAGTCGRDCRAGCDELGPWCIDQRYCCCGHRRERRSVCLWSAWGHDHQNKSRPKIRLSDPDNARSAVENRRVFCSGRCGERLPTIEISRETLLHMEATTPLPLVDDAGTVASPQQSMFQTDCAAIKVRANCAWACVPGAAQVVSGINWWTIDAEQRRILAEARATLRKPPPERYVPPTTEPLLYATHDPADDEPEEYVPGLDTAPAAPPFDWVAYIDERIEARVMLEREFTMAVVGEALGNAIVEMRDAQRKDDTSELTQEIAKLQSICDELRIALGADRRKSSTDVVELPPWPRRTGRDVN
jgi:hypothetical protein